MAVIYHGARRYLGSTDFGIWGLLWRFLNCGARLRTTTNIVCCLPSARWITTTHTGKVSNFQAWQSLASLEDNSLSSRTLTTNEGRKRSGSHGNGCYAVTISATLLATDLSRSPSAYAALQILTATSFSIYYLRLGCMP